MLFKLILKKFKRQGILFNRVELDIRTKPKGKVDRYSFDKYIGPGSNNDVYRKREEFETQKFLILVNSKKI